MIKHDFERFQTTGSSVILKKKVVIVPEVRNSKGFIYTMGNNYNKEAWVAHIDLSIGNKNESRRSGASTGIFYVRNIDEHSRLDGQNGYSQNFDGLGITLSSGVLSEDGNVPANLIRGIVNDGRGHSEHGAQQCYKPFRNLA